MKKNRTLLGGLIVVLMMCLLPQAHTQIEVDSENRVGVGALNTAAKANITNGDYIYGLNLTSSRTGHDNYSYGLYNTVQNTSTKSNGNIVGLYNGMNGTATYVSGIWNQINQANGTWKRGILNTINGKGTNEKLYGIGKLYARYML